VLEFAGRFRFELSQIGSVGVTVIPTPPSRSIVINAFEIANPGMRTSIKGGLDRLSTLRQSFLLTPPHNAETG
jgi:hypothetical protein